MKKTFAILSALCLTATTLGVTAFAEGLSFSALDRGTDGGRKVASIFSDGSLALIVATVALVASGVAIFLTLYLNKKKDAPAEKNDKEDDE
jgi:hypothetical protein